MPVQASLQNVANVSANKVRHLCHVGLVDASMIWVRQVPTTSYLCNMHVEDNAAESCISKNCPAIQSKYKGQNWTKSGDSH